MAQAVLVTLDEFFAPGEFSQPVEDAWVTVLGVVDQLVLDPDGASPLEGVRCRRLS